MVYIPFPVHVQLFCDPMNYGVHGILQARILEWVAFSFARGSSNPGIEPQSPSLWADSLPAEPQGKPKYTGVGSLSLLQQIFLTQESNPSLLHCRRIHYQLSLDSKASACSAETWVLSLGKEDPLEKEMATHSSILARKIPWTKESDRLQSIGSQGVGHD